MRKPLGKELEENLKGRLIEEDEFNSLEAARWMCREELGDGLINERSGARFGEAEDAGGAGRQAEPAGPATPRRRPHASLPCWNPGPPRRAMAAASPPPCWIWALAAFTMA